MAKKAAEVNPFDRLSRLLVKRVEAPLLGWYLGLTPEQFAFRRWLDTRNLPIHGVPDRTNDTLAELADLLRDGIPWAMPLEFSATPDPEMFGRLMVYLGLVWLGLKPSLLPGDRYCVGAIVVNLTGNGTTSRVYNWPEAKMMTALQIVEVNMAAFDAMKVMDEVAMGQAPRVVLAYIPLMRGGNEASIIERWKELASAEPEAVLRRDLGAAAMVYAELTDCNMLWKRHLEGWQVLQSKTVLEWEGMGRVAQAIEDILDNLEVKFGPVPNALHEKIQNVGELSRLKEIRRATLSATSLDEFRTKAGLD